MSNAAEHVFDNAMKPKVAESDGQKVEQHSLKEQIEAAKFYSEYQAIKNGKRGFKITKMRSGGAI